MFRSRKDFRNKIKMMPRYLMKGLEMARTVRINQDGWVMISDFRFFLSLNMQIRRRFWYYVYLKLFKYKTDVYKSFFFIPSVNHLIAFLQPANAWHFTTRGSSVNVNDQVVLRHQHLQTAHHVPEGQHAWEWTSEEKPNYINVVSPKWGCCISEEIYSLI